MNITEIIQQFGFPVACVVACGWFILYMYKNSENNNKERENKLYNELAECRIINKQAIETIATYASKLDNIQDDVSYIKEKVGVK